MHSEFFSVLPDGAFAIFVFLVFCMEKVAVVEFSGSMLPTTLCEGLDFNNKIFEVSPGIVTNFFYGSVLQLQKVQG